MDNRYFFDVKGYVKIEVIGASQRDLGLLRKFGSISQPVDSMTEANIIIRFVERLVPGNLNFLGVNQFGYTDTEFFVLNPLNGEIDAQIPLDQIGGTCEIVCRRGISSIPLLDEILKISLLQNKILSLHASAVLYQQQGVVMMGWVRSGKTSALLACLADGGKFVADDWVLFDLNQDQIFGFSGKISVSEEQLKQVQTLKNRIGIFRLLSITYKKIFVQLVNLAANIIRFKLFYKLSSKLREKSRMDFYPEEIFIAHEIVDRVTPKMIMLLTSHDQETCFAEKISVDEMADTFINANDQEFNSLQEIYRAFCFAFPDKHNIHIENRSAVEKQLLKEAFTGKETIRMYHPYPLQFNTFMEEIRKVF